MARVCWAVVDFMIFLVDGWNLIFTNRSNGDVWAMAADFVRLGSENPSRGEDFVTFDADLGAGEPDGFFEFVAEGDFDEQCFFAFAEDFCVLNFVCFHGVVELTVWIKVN